MTEHMEGRGKIHFMGTHELQLSGDLAWSEDGETAAVTGCGKMKMMKWLTYPFSEDMTAKKTGGDGSFQCTGGLKSQFGNGSLNAEIDIHADNTFSGHIDLGKGISLPFEGTRTD